MRRLQTLIAIIFETRPRPCRIAVRANSKNYSLKDCFQVNMIRSREQFRLATTGKTSSALRSSKNHDQKSPTAAWRRSAFPKSAPGELQPPSFLNKGLELRLHWLAQPGTLSAPARSAKPRSHSERREVKALLARQLSESIIVRGIEASRITENAFNLA